MKINSYCIKFVDNKWSIEYDPQNLFGMTRADAIHLARDKNCEGRFGVYSQC